MEKTTLLRKAFLTLVFILISLPGVSQIAPRGTATTITGTGTSLIIAKPTGIQVGDIMIANISESHATNNLTTIPNNLPGWTLINSINLGANNVRGTVLYKIAVAADVSATNYTFSINASANSSVGAIIAFSGVNPITPFDVTPGIINPTNAASITATGITTATDNAAIVMLGQVGDDLTYSGWNTTSPGALTGLYVRTTTNGFDTSVGAAWALKTSVGATGNGTATLTGTNRSGAILLALKPAPPTITSLGAASGCVGSSITINGTNLTGAIASGVTIGSTAVSSITSNTGSVLVAVVGAGTTGTVSVTTPGGSATSAATFTVNALPTAGLSSNDADNTFCAGTSVTFTATGGTNYNFRVNGTSVQNSATATYTTTTLTNTQAVTVIVTNAAGCSITSSGISNTVNALPTAGLSSNDADNTFCAGTSVTFTATGGTNYNFRVNGTSVQNSATATYTTTTLTNGQIVTVIVTNATGCSITSSGISNTVNALPTAGLSSNDADNTFCAGTSVTFTATGGTNYNFRVNGTSVQNSATATYTTTTLTNTQAVTVIVTNATGCSTTSSGITNTVNALPTAGLTSNDADNIFCAGTSVTFTATGGTNYNFRVNGTSVQNSATATYTTSTLTNGQIVTVIVTNAAGCSTTSSGITNTVNALPIAGLTSNDADNTFCAGTSITFTATGGTNYNFRVNGTTVQNSASATYTTTTLTNGQIVTVIVTNVCGSTTSLGITNTVNAIPTITSTTPGSRVETGTVALGATASAGTISWFAALTGGSALGTGTSYTTPSIVNTTTYYVETNNSGCISTPRTAIIAAITRPEINVQGNTTNIGDGDTIPQVIDFTDFGESVTGTPISKTFLIQNTGTATLNITSVVLSNTTDFTITTPPSTSIAAASFSTFVITFNSATASLKTSTLTINNNDTSEAAYDFTIQGTATVLNPGPEIRIEANLTLIPDGKTTYNTADLTEFGDNFTGVSTIRNYTIYNTGSTTLNISSWTTSNTADFSISTSPSTTVAPGSSTTFAVTFNTATAGLKTSIISIVNNDSSENPYNFNIRGTGIVAGAAQEIQIEGNSNLVPDNATITSINNWTILGDSFVGSPLVRTYTIKNIGATALTIGALTKGGTNASEFVVSAISASIAGNSQTTFTITFTPTGTGTRTATISIVNNDGSENPYNFYIEGNGVATAPGVSEIDVQGNKMSIVNGDTSPDINDLTDFGSAQVLTNPQIKTFTIRNYGGSDLNLSGIPLVAISGSPDFTLVAAPSTPIVSLGSTNFSIQFNPSSLGPKNATITIQNNDTNEAVYTFNIQGIAIQTFYDSDGDTVYDNKDVDDDNDGIRDITEEVNCNNSFGNKVDYKFLNETFGAGARTTINTTYAAKTTYGFQNAATPTDIEGSGSTLDLNDGKYTVGTSAQISSWADQFWYKGTDHTGNANGRMAIFNASYTPGIFYTAQITGALPNIPITYSFWVLNIDRTDAPSVGTRLRPNIRVEFRDINDNVLQTLSTGAIQPTTTGNLAGNWVQFTSNLTFSVSEFKVIFINNETGGLGNDLALDDILITQKLCDLDGDGVADLFDLDADNDGIEDVIEAGLGNMSNARGKIDVAWADSNINGLHDSAESAAALPALDSDGDTIPNYIDLDSDNDSLFDVDESGAGNTNAVTGFVNGDGDITGDGKGDGPESETFRNKDTDGDSITEGFGDGILDVYDYGVGVTFNTQYGNLNQGIANANPATTYLKDTDNDGIADYLDVKSNGPLASFDIANTLLIYDYKTLDTDNNGVIDGLIDVDKDGIIDIFDTASTPRYFGSPRDMRTKLFLDFDGRNDYGQSTAILGGLANASLMAWIDLNPGFSGEGVIVGQDKFQIRINSSRQLEAFINSTVVTHTVSLNVSQWYNVGATYDGSNIKLYLNGNLVKTQAVSGAIGVDASLLTIGRNPIASTKFFKGKIDEVRVFNAALTASQLQRMVYQEIKDFGSEIRGEVVSKNIATSPASLPFANVLRYYRMDTYKDDIIDDLTTPTVDLTGTKIYNHKNIFVQQAPMPFITEQTGNFATAVHSTAKDIRGLDLTEIDYSIVRVKHNITETANNTDLAMFIDPGIIINMTNDTKIQNDWYLKLDGKIDLVDKSQLVQTIESDLDVTSAGSIERDQHGESNKFNYNYWSSPVSSINTTTINHGFSIADVMKDGTTTTPQNLTWTNGYDGAATSPITISTYWLYKFQNLNNSYANWASVSQNGTLLSGQGYTMKGSATTALSQNYTYVGKPNSGTITSTVSANNLNLCGNPYSSAIDANQFIDDNSTSIKGTLYFWEHYNSNTTHNLAEYQGGYATYTKTGATPPVAPALVSGLGSSSKTPKRFIPVGQGFFVTGSPTGGTITFNNGQRLFVKEDDVSSYSLFRSNSNATVNAAFNNSNDSYTTTQFMKLRLGYNSTSNHHKQILLGFMDQNATSGYDEGYDGLCIETVTNDFYFVNGTNKLNIQGDGYFNVNNIYPLGVKNAIAGNVKFGVVEKENFNQDQEIYIYDSLNNLYHSIKSQDFVINLPAGVTENRFSLRFTNSTSLGTNENEIQNTITIAHSQSNNIINIKNDSLEVTVKSVMLFNLIGQSIMTWNIDNSSQTNIELQVRDVSTGAYIVKAVTDNGNITKKILIK